MNQRALVVASVLFVLIVGAMFAYSYVKRTELEEVTPQFVQPVTETDTEEVLVNGVHFFENGKHTVVGSVIMPTPCHLIESNVTVAESMPQQATIALKVINNSDTCAQVLTPQRFQVSFDAAENAVISLTIDGKHAKLNLREANAGEKPETIDDMYFKG